MTEITNGIWNTVKNIAGTSSLNTQDNDDISMKDDEDTRKTNTERLWEAGAVAVVEPAINSVWFYVLHKFWASNSKKRA